MREDVVKIRKNGEEFFVKIIMIRDDGTIIAKDDCVLQPIKSNDTIIIHNFDIIELYGVRLR
jgi:hypothetical protein